MAFYLSSVLGKHDPSDAIWELQLIVSVQLKSVCILLITIYATLLKENNGLFYCLWKRTL